MFKSKPAPAPDPDEGGTNDVEVVMFTPDPAPISLATLAAELDEPIDKLMIRLDTEIFVDELTHLRCVSVETCRRVIDEHDAAVEAKREQGRVRAIEAQESRRRRRDGDVVVDAARLIRDRRIAAAIDSGMTAAEAMASVDGEPDFSMIVDGEIVTPRAVPDRLGAEVLFKDGVGSGARISPVRQARKPRGAA